MENHHNISFKMKFKQGGVSVVVYDGINGAQLSAANAIFVRIFFLCVLPYGVIEKVRP